MKLITKEIGQKLLAADQAYLASEDGTTSDEIIVKYFVPWAAGTWYIVSGTPLDSAGQPVESIEAAEDWHLFGFADLGHPGAAELGYVLLSQLEAISGPAGLKIERDLHYNAHEKLSDVQMLQGAAS